MLHSKLMEAGFDHLPNPSYTAKTDINIDRRREDYGAKVAMLQDTLGRRDVLVEGCWDLYRLI